MKTPINTRLSANRFESRRNHGRGGREPPENDEKGNGNGGFQIFAEKLKMVKCWFLYVFFAKCFPTVSPLFPHFLKMTY